MSWIGTWDAAGSPGRHWNGGGGWGLQVSAMFVVVVVIELIVAPRIFSHPRMHRFSDYDFDNDNDNDNDND